MAKLKKQRIKIIENIEKKFQKEMSELKYN